MVSGQVEPDTYVIDTETFALRSVRVGEAKAPVLTDDEAIEVGRLGDQVARLYRRPMDIEWAFAGEGLWLLQARPVTRSVPPNEMGPTALARRGARHGQ